MGRKRFIRKIMGCWQTWKGTAQVSFSEVGEDLIVNYLFQSLKISSPTYLDIGANHPIIGSNTYFFYLRRCEGVCIEPDPNLFKLIRKIRPLDKVINGGIVADENRNVEFYIFPHPYTGWNTFSKEEAENKTKETGIAIKKIMTVPMHSINEIIEEHFNQCPNFISLDVEGLDLSILKSMDFEKFRPEVICAETISFSASLNEKKLDDIISFVESKDYFVYADTHANTIFCRKDSYNLHQ